MDKPIALAEALASFEELWDPRIVTRVNDYDVRIAKVQGDFVWHTHDHTDEFFLVLDGELRIELRDPDLREVRLPRGSVYTVPRGTEHRPVSPDGASILMFEPAGTVNVGEHDAAARPAHITATTGRELGD